MTRPTLFERMTRVAWPLPEGHVKGPGIAVMGDECTCPACRSDVVGLVPCMTPANPHFPSAAASQAAVRKNPERAAPPAGGSSHSLPAGESEGRA